MYEIITPISLAAAGGLGFLAVAHQKQFKELADFLIWVPIVIGSLAFIISMTIDMTASEIKYEIDRDKRDAAVAVVESWSSFWIKTAMFCGGALVYLLILFGISQSIEEERKSKLESNNNAEDNPEVTESD